MKFVVNLTDARGKGKVKIVEALNVKEAEAKAKSKYPSYEVGRISPNKDVLNYYKSMKDLNG